MAAQTKVVRRTRRASESSQLTSRTRKQNNSAPQGAAARRDFVIRFLPALFILVMVATILLPQLLSLTLGAAGRVITSVPGWLSNVSFSFQPPAIAPLFTPQVDYWAEDLRRWGREHEVDPNLLATIMQIESCGYDTVASNAGAQGLFQVMPFHFQTGEVMTDPDTNALRGASFINECLGYANGDPGLALACYNGGPSVLRRAFNTWPAETQRYYTWGSAIYKDAQANLGISSTLGDWLNAGGVYLCDRASQRLGLN